VFEEFASGAHRARPQLAAGLARVRRGDTLAAARTDRLARSLSRLLHVVEACAPRGRIFPRSPTRSTRPALGAVAEFERSLIRERTKACLRAERA